MPSIRFTGVCRYKDDDSQKISGNEAPSVDSPEECHEKCKGEWDCVAFSFNEFTNFCYLYAEGPYTHGDGDSSYTCYVMQSTNYDFLKYECWEFRNIFISPIIQARYFSLTVVQGSLVMMDGVEWMTIPRTNLRVLSKIVTPLVKTNVMRIIDALHSPTKSLKIPIY